MSFSVGVDPSREYRKDCRPLGVYPTLGKISRVTRSLLVALTSPHSIWISVWCLREVWTRGEASVDFILCMIDALGHLLSHAANGLKQKHAHDDGGALINLRTSVINFGESNPQHA